MDERRRLQSIPDDALLHRLAELMGQSRRVEADVVAHIAEVDERRLYAREAFPSMFAYCTDVLHLSEAEAYLRIAAARASREHPMLLTMLADGRLHLTAIAKLAPHLTRENREALLERATHRSKRQVERKLERLQALMGSKGRDGDLAAVIEQAVTEKLERLEAHRFGRTKAPRKGPASSRHIPAVVQRAVRARDGDRCRYVDDHGRRCKDRNHLQFHHRHPFGFGGEHSAENIRLMCRAHNAYLAECDYGRDAMARHRRSRSRALPAAAG